MAIPVTRWDLQGMPEFVDSFLRFIQEHQDYLLLPSSRYNTSALNLAESSQSMRACVQSIYKHSIQIDPSTKDPDRWAKVFASDIRELILTFSNVDRISDEILNLLQSPSLREVRTVDATRIMHELCTTRQLRSLHIQMHDDTSGNEVLRIVDTMSLKKLVLVCICRADCCFEYMKVVGSEALSLPTIQAMELYCCAMHKCDREKWPVFGDLPALRTLKLNIDVRQCAIDNLRTLDEVAMFDAKDGFEVAKRIGSPVTELSAIVVPKPVNQESLSGLTVCSKLFKLGLRLRSGAELEIPRIAASLRELYLIYESSKEAIHVHKYCELQPGVIMEIMYAAPVLTSVHICRARMPLTELRHMLRFKGGQLEVLGTSITGQEEPPCERLCELLEAAATWNPSLVHFESPDFVSARSIAKNVDGVAIKRLSRAHSCLKKQAPELKAPRLNDFIEDISRFAKNDQQSTSPEVGT